MYDIHLRIPIGNQDKHPEHLVPIGVRGLDLNGNSPLFLGFLRDGASDITHIVCKMPGYQWYYNRYHPIQYSPASVHIYRVKEGPSYDNKVVNDKPQYWMDFVTDTPVFDEAWQKQKEKK